MAPIVKTTSVTTLLTLKNLIWSLRSYRDLSPLNMEPRAVDELGKLQVKGDKGDFRVLCHYPNFDKHA